MTESMQSNARCMIRCWYVCDLRMMTDRLKNLCANYTGQHGNAGEADVEMPGSSAYSISAVAKQIFLLQLWHCRTSQRDTQRAANLATLRGKINSHNTDYFERTGGVSRSICTTLPRVIALATGHWAGPGSLTIAIQSRLFRKPPKMCAF